MPELPEVESTVRELEKKILGDFLQNVWSEKERKDLKRIEGKRIEEIRRFGKNISFFLDSGEILLIHLRMTGHLLLGNWELKKKAAMEKEEWWSKEPILQDKRNGFLRVIFFLESGKQIALSDPRKFAKVSLLQKKEMEKIIQELGPNPLFIKKKEFKKLFEGRKKAIKPLLMDQTFLAGIGNIYAAEILFKAKVNPCKKASLLKREEIESIYYFTREVLKKGIKLKGDSTSDYRLPSGKKGGYQEHHLVYKRENLPCFECKEKIKRTVVGSRGTYYCPSCQKKE